MRGSPGESRRRSSGDTLGAGPRLPLHEPRPPGSEVVGLNFPSVDIRKSETHTRASVRVQKVIQGLGRCVNGIGDVSM